MADKAKIEKSLQGMNVDLEMQILIVVSVLTTLKFAPTLVDKELLTNICRAFFTLGHLYMIYIFLYTNYRLTKSKSRTAEEKSISKAACFKVFRGILVSGVISAAVHIYSGMLPPMVIPVFMGFISLIGNDFFYQVLYTQFPSLFEFLYR